MIAIFPELIAAARGGDVERLAVLVRRYFGGSATFRPRPDVEAMLASAGIRVERLATGERGALLAKDQSGRFSIVAVIEPDLDEVAERFLLAHQLGHFLLDIQPLIAQGDWQVSGFREAYGPLQRYASGDAHVPASAIDERRELRADAFAAALLMPHGMVKKAMERLRSIERVAELFGVSVAAVQRRMEALGLSARPAPANFIEAERRIAAQHDAGLGTLDEDGAASQQAVQELAKAAAVLAPANMPRSLAAASYGRTAAKTRQIADVVPEPSPSPSPSRPAAVPTPVAERSTAEASPPTKGMARIRELARRLEAERQRR